MPHRVMAQNTLQMPYAAASAEPLLGIQRDHAMTRLPDALAAWITAESQTAAERPDATHLIELVAGRRNPGRQCVGVIEDQNRRRRKGRREERLQVQAFHLLQVRGLLDHPATDDARHP